MADPNNWLTTTGDDTMPGINGVMMERGGYVTATTDTFDVPSHEDAIKKIVGVGGKVLMPRTVVPGIGYMAYYETLREMFLE